MIDRVVDLTQLCVTKEIQYMLLESPEYQGNVLLQDIYHRQELTEYVLSNIDRRYMTIEELNVIPVKTNEILPQCPIEERTVIRRLLKIGMSKIVENLLEIEQKANRQEVGGIR